MVIHILGVPMDLGSGRRGVDMGPSAIRIAGIAAKLRALGHTVVDDGDLYVRNMEEIDPGDVHARYLREIVRASRLIATKVERVAEHGHFPLVLGGDHAIAIGTISGLAARSRRRRKRLGLLWIDAHADINTPATSPSGNIHGMPLASVLGLGPRGLASIAGPGSTIDPANVALVGIRSVDEGERRHLREAGVHVYTMSDIDRKGMPDVMKRALSEVSHRTDSVHVSFDLDAVDPALAPGVGTPVQGGLDYREAHLLMEMIADSRVMSSLEIVEVNPILDHHNKSAEFAVELVESAFGKNIL